MLKNIPEFELLETLLWTREEGFYLLERHLFRLFNSAAYFHDHYEKHYFAQIPSSEEITSEILNVSEPYREKYERLRIRILLSPSGGLQIQVSEEKPTLFDNMPYVVVDDQPVDSHDIFLRHKTTYRVRYNQARERALIGTPDGPFDVILYNERGEVTETSIGNIAIEMANSDGSENIWKTPCISSGLLGGVHREELISQKGMVEGIITLKELQDTTKNNRRIKIFNSVRKDIFVRLELTR
ncbi:hypothetical protein K7432_009950 [Basidiobolus ranarum]|uniref:Aminotransferase class IV n=1 Tax=Basidiobolus ranarum TaxID=34480 RepID=A0ABR2VW99_9FUNG